MISAVGHETDFTIADYVADLRAPTPSAAAEIAVFDYDQFKKEVNGFRDRLRKGVEGNLKTGENRLGAYRLRLERHRPDRELNAKRQFLAESEQRMRQALDSRIAGMWRMLERTGVRLEQDMSGKMTASRHRLELLAGRLDAGSPLKRLSGGYAYVSGPGGKQVKAVRELKAGDRVGLYFSDGRAEAEIAGTFAAKNEERNGYRES